VEGFRVKAMAKSDQKDIELHPDAWERFKRAVGIVAKSPPQHKVRDKRKLSSGKQITTKKRR
jgi:hypothetical protein